MQKVKRSCRKLAQKLSCMNTPWVEPDYPARSGATSSGSLRTPTGSSQPVTGDVSAVRTPPHYSAGKDPANEDDEDDDDEDDDDDPRSSAYSTTSGTLGSRTRSACLS